MRPVNKWLSGAGYLRRHRTHYDVTVMCQAVTYGGSKVTGTIHFGNWGSPLNKRIPHIFIGGPHMIISPRAPYKYLEAPRIILGLTCTIHFRNWGIPINMKFPI